MRIFLCDDIQSVAVAKFEAKATILSAGDRRHYRSSIVKFGTQVGGDRIEAAPADGVLLLRDRASVRRMMDIATAKDGATLSR
jgi:hypothetical protein